MRDRTQGQPLARDAMAYVLAGGRKYPVRLAGAERARSSSGVVLGRPKYSR